jgi:hypothetical protein
MLAMVRPAFGTIAGSSGGILAKLKLALLMLRRVNTHRHDITPTSTWIFVSCHLEVALWKITTDFAPP